MRVALQCMTLNIGLDWWIAILGIAVKLSGKSALQVNVVLFLAISIGVKAMNYFLSFSEESDVKLYDPKSFSATRLSYVFTTVLDMTQLLLSY